MCELIDYHEDQKSQAHLLVGVGSAIVVDLQLRCEHPRDILLRLPANTPVTLDRKAIQFRGTHDVTIRSLRGIIEKTVEDAAENPEKIALLHEGLIAWEASAALPLSLSNVLQEEFDAFLQKSDLTPYPLSHDKQLRPILKSLGLEQTLPASPRLLRYDYRTVIRLLSENATTHEDLVDLPVIFVPDTLLSHITDCGLQGCLFAPESLLIESHCKSDLAFKIATRYSEYGRRLSLHPSLIPREGDPSSEAGPGLIFTTSSSEINGDGCVA